jgi:hypothetical protein
MELLKGMNTTEIFDGVIIGLIKFAEEKATTPFIGNGTLKSGAIKLIAGSVIKSSFKGNKIVGYVGSALQVDGTEDIAYWLWNKFFNKSSETQEDNSIVL